MPNPKDVGGREKPIDIIKSVTGNRNISGMISSFYEDGSINPLFLPYICKK